MKEIYVAVAETDSGDKYLYAFLKKPTRSEVCELVRKDEGCGEDLEYYEQFTGVQIDKCKIR